MTLVIVPLTRAKAGPLMAQNNEKVWNIQSGGPIMMAALNTEISSSPFFCPNGQAPWSCPEEW